MSCFIISAFADEADKDLSVQLDVMEKHDIHYIEIRNVGGKSITKYTLDEVREIKKQLDARKIKISAVGSPVGKIKITDDFAPHLELFKHTLEIAKILDTKYIRMFSFYIPDGEDPAKYRDDVMNRWKEFIKAAEGTGITLLHENEKNIYGDTPDRCLDLLETMNCPYVGVTFDPANFVQCDVETYPTAYNMLRKYIKYMHIKDACYSDHKVVPAGHGDGKVKEILSSLKNSGFEGFVTLEPHLGNFVGFASLEPGAEVKNKAEGGAGVFDIAVPALRRILDEI